MESPQELTLESLVDLPWGTKGKTTYWHRIILESETSSCESASRSCSKSMFALHVLITIYYNILGIY